MNCIPLSVGRTWLAVRSWSQGTEKQMSFEELFLVWKEGAEWLCRGILTGGSNGDRVVLSPMSRVHVCFLFFVSMGTCVCVCLHMTQPMCASQRTIYGSHFSPSTMWVPRIEDGLSGLVAKYLCLSAEPFWQL